METSDCICIGKELRRDSSVIHCRERCKYAYRRGAGTGRGRSNHVISADEPSETCQHSQGSPLARSSGGVRNAFSVESICAGLPMRP